MPGKLNLNTTTETDTCRRIRPGVLVNSDNAAMYVEYGKHPLGLTDDDDCFYYLSWRNNVLVAFGTLSSFLT